MKNFLSLHHQSNTNMQYDIFISYKRKGTSSATAAFVYDFLIRKGYTVFFDRKEMGQGYFDNQLNEYIDKAKDIIILLEEGSLSACFVSDKYAYKTDWFCKEIIHALEKKKRIIPLLLDDYKMPDTRDIPIEMNDLTKQNAITFESVDIEHVYKEYFIEKKYLLSSPRNMYLSQLEGEGIADFLFYSKGDAEVYEFGNLVGIIDQSVDDEHPFKLPVRRTGEHRFRVENLDTSEVQTVKETINRDEQRYVEIVWQKLPNIWENTVDSTTLLQYQFQFGLALFKGNSKHEPNPLKALEYFKMGADKGHEFIRNHVNEIATDKKANPKLVREWLETAANHPINSVQSMLLLAQMFKKGEILQINLENSFMWFKRAADFDNPLAYYNLGLMYQDGLGVEKDLLKAEELFLKAVDGKIIEAYLALVQLYFDNDENAKALNLAEALIKEDPTNQKAIELLNTVRQKITEERAQRYSKEVLTIDLSQIKFNMIRVKGGKMKVDPTTEASSKSETYENKRHEIDVPTFYIAQFPVTQNIWKEIMGTNHSTFSSLENDAFINELKNEKSINAMYNVKGRFYGRNPNEAGHTKANKKSISTDEGHYPVENINYYMCCEFVKRLSEKTGHTFSMPTEEEWEYAARGGQKAQGFKYAGSNTLDDISWHKGNSNRTTHPVGQKEPNTLGIYDMSGNVWEWTETSAHNPDIQGKYYLCCGGSFNDDEKNNELSMRVSMGKHAKAPNVGLRVVIRNVE